jgi:hypothetical protein
VSFDVQPTREDRWDRFVIVRGFWDWRIIESLDWNAKRIVGWWLSSSAAGLAAMSVRAVNDGRGAFEMRRCAPGTTCYGRSIR